MKTYKLDALPLYQFALIVTAKKDKAEELTKKVLQSSDSLQTMWQELALCDIPMGEQYLYHAVTNGVSNRLATTFCHLCWDERGILFLKLFLNADQDRICEITGFSQEDLSKSLNKTAREINHQQVKTA